MASMSGMPAARLVYGGDHRAAFDGFGEPTRVDLGSLYRDHRSLLLAVVQVS
jgi:hypothetical protein